MLSDLFPSSCSPLWLIGTRLETVEEGLIDSNIVAVEEWPERELVGPHLTNLAGYREALTMVMTKLVRPVQTSHGIAYNRRGRVDEQERLLGKLSMLIDQSEKIYFEAHSKQPSEFFDEPLWYTWTFIHFSMYFPLPCDPAPVIG